MRTNTGWHMEASISGNTLPRQGRKRPHSRCRSPCMKRPSQLQEHTATKKTCRRLGESMLLIIRYLANACGLSCTKPSKAAPLKANISPPSAHQRARLIIRYMNHRTLSTQRNTIRQGCFFSKTFHIKRLVHTFPSFCKVPHESPQSRSRVPASASHLQSEAHNSSNYRNQKSHAVFLADLYGCALCGRCGSRAGGTGCGSSASGCRR